MVNKTAFSLEKLLKQKLTEMFKNKTDLENFYFFLILEFLIKVKE